MPRNGSGAYSLPSGQPVVTGTTISSSTHNALMADISTEITRSIASDGQTVPTANLPMGGFKHTGLAAGSNNGDSVRYEQLAAGLASKPDNDGTGATGTWGISISGNAATASNGGVTSVNGLTGAVVIQGVPTGAVSYFAMSSAPEGWLKANGALVSRTTYASLFAAIGTVFGAGDGSTTFALPDLRGEFLRGYDDSRGIDAGRIFGTSQLDQMQKLEGAIEMSPPVGNGLSGVFKKGSSGTGAASGTSTRYSVLFDSSGSPGARVSDTTDGETRPRNVALLACIKY